MADIDKDAKIKLEELEFTYRFRVSDEAKRRIAIVSRRTHRVFSTAHLYTFNR